jgi:FkbM family methyltransferase
MKYNALKGLIKKIFRIFPAYRMAEKSYKVMEEIKSGIVHTSPSLIELLTFKHGLDYHEVFITTVGLGPNWLSYMLSHNMVSTISMLRRGLDKKSLAALDLAVSRMMICPNGHWRNYKMRLTYLNSFYTPEEMEHIKIYEQELPQYRADFWLGEYEDHVVEVFTYHSGLKGKNTKLYKYIKDKDFVDAGAYIGDSALVYLRYYNPHKVYSFEVSEKNCAKYETVMRKNNISPDKYEICHYGLSDKRREISIDDAGNPGTGVGSLGNDKAHLVDLDSFVQEKRLNIGFIKADVEGHGIQCLRGMAETIKRDRPVLSLSIYHNPEEFFEVKPLLDEITIGLGYKITLEQPWPFPEHPLREIILFAFPMDLDEDGGGGVILSSSCCIFVLYRIAAQKIREQV